MKIIGVYRKKTPQADKCIMHDAVITYQKTIMSMLTPETKMSGFLKSFA